MGRDAKVNVYALAFPGLPPRLRVRGRSLNVNVVEGARPGRAGAVAVIGERVFDPPSLSEDSLREQHAIVMDLWRRTDALLPVRFGTVIAWRELKTRIAAASGALVESLHHVRGRVQMTVRVLGEPVGPVAPTPPAASGTAYLTALRDRAAALSELAAQVRTPVTALVMDERVEPGQGRLRLSVFHLIAAADEAAYRATLEPALVRVLPQRAMVSGPWPPFAFVPEVWR